jgi:hypothetical protein
MRLPKACVQTALFRAAYFLMLELFLALCCASPTNVGPSADCIAGVVSCLKY